MTVYLLHFTRPYHHARHYIGFTDDLNQRIEEHRQGTSKAKLMAVIKSAGIGFKLVRTWDGGRDTERKLKRQRNAAALCPLCRKAKLKRKRKAQQKYRAKLRQRMASGQVKFSDN